MKYFDMTSVGKECGIKGNILLEYGIRCFQDLGMTRPCATIWAYNAKYDSSQCESICLKDFFEDYNGPAPTCALNDCL